MRIQPPKMTPAQCAKLRQLAATTTVSLQDLATRFGISKTYVRAIVGPRPLPKETA